MKRSKTNSNQCKRLKKTPDIPIIAWNSEWDHEYVTCHQCNTETCAWNLLFECPYDQLYLKCPDCSQHLMTIDYSSPKEYVHRVRTYCKDDDYVKYRYETITKNSELERIKFLEIVEKSKLRSADQLPDINSEEIIITWKIGQGDSQYKTIDICYKNQVLWTEILIYEHYERYLEVGKILKEKYKKKLKDFIPDSSILFDLYGDCGESIQMVAEFRKSI